MRWKRALVRATLVVAACVCADTGMGASPHQSAAAAASSSNPAWLREINRYREAAHLHPVRDQPAWDRAIRQHLIYLEKTPKRLLVGRYANAHIENPASPYYTSAGAREGASSDLALGAVGYTPVAFIDGWLAAPFHAIGMLRPGLRQVAFASDSRGYAGLDVLSGLTLTLPGPGTSISVSINSSGGLSVSQGPPSAPPAPVLFPGPGMTTALSTYGGEVPNPLQTCRWPAGTQAGLPLIALLPRDPLPGLTARVTSPEGAVITSGSGQLCIVDAHTYRSSDPVYGPTGLSILRSDHAVFVIPKHPLQAGRYGVVLQQPGRAPIAWSFTEKPR